MGPLRPHARLGTFLAILRPPKQLQTRKTRRVERETPPIPPSPLFFWVRAISFSISEIFSKIPIVAASAEIHATYSLQRWELRSDAGGKAARTRKRTENGVLLSAWCCEIRRPGRPRVEQILFVPPSLKLNAPGGSLV